MASIYDLKPRFQALLRPATRRLAAAGVSANQVTLAAVVLSLLAGGAIALWPEQRLVLLAVPAVLLLRMALNAVDGMLAREHDMKSPLGAVLNELGDVVSDTTLYLPLALVPGCRPVIVVAIVVIAIMAEMTGVVAVQIGASRRYDGPIGKSDRAFAFGALCLLLGCGVPAGWWLDVVLGAIALLGAVTIVNRARRALREIAR